MSSKASVKLIAAEITSDCSVFLPLDSFIDNCFSFEQLMQKINNNMKTVISIYFFKICSPIYAILQSETNHLNYNCNFLSRKYSNDLRWILKCQLIPFAYFSFGYVMNVKKGKICMIVKIGYIGSKHSVKQAENIAKNMSSIKLKTYTYESPNDVSRLHQKAACEVDVICFSGIVSYYYRNRSLIGKIETVISPFHKYMVVA